MFDVEVTGEESLTRRQVRATGKHIRGMYIFFSFRLYAVARAGAV